MKVGIVGFAGSGKTTIFNTLTGLGANVGFGAKDQSNLGMIKVPDPRVDFLAEIDKPKKVTYAEIGFVDSPGPDKSQTGQGLETRLVNEMRKADALVHVVRAFENPALSRPPNPSRDMAAFEEEMVLSDLVQIEARLERLRKEGTKSRERTLLEALQVHLEAGRPLRTKSMTDQERLSIKGFEFLSLKPCIVLVNQPDVAATSGPNDELAAAAAENGLNPMALAGQVEAEIAELPPEDQQEFLADLGLTNSARDRFVKATYAQLDLISFLTHGPDDCHAWTIKRGTPARTAAGKIHSDIERGFIRAEVIAFSDFEKHRSEAACREAGVFRVEGKDYLVQDGDVINFRFNV